MPNTLAHIGVQFSLEKSIHKNADPRWISLGLLIPDIPWIMQRLALFLAPNISPIDLRAYCVTQTTPLFCVILSIAISLLFENKRVVFKILAIQSTLHLILDCLQEKGDVGIPFLGPIHWGTYSLPVFSMDGLISTLFSLSGLAVLLLIAFRKITYPRLHLSKPHRFNLFLALSLLLFYLVIPYILIGNVIDANVHELKTWKQPENRIGKGVHFDRSKYIPGSPGLIIDQFNPKGTAITGIDLNEPALISTSATFTDNNLLHTDHYIIHPSNKRFSYTIAGLLGIVFIWTWPLSDKLKPMSQRQHDNIQA